jgi:hypothetical protein
MAFSLSHFSFGSDVQVGPATAEQGMIANARTIKI